MANLIAGPLRPWAQVPPLIANEVAANPGRGRSVSLTAGAATATRRATQRAKKRAAESGSGKAGEEGEGEHGAAVGAAGADRDDRSGMRRGEAVHHREKGHEREREQEERALRRVRERDQHGQQQEDADRRPGDDADDDRKRDDAGDGGDAAERGTDAVLKRLQRGERLHAGADPDAKADAKADEQERDDGVDLVLRV